MSPPHTPCWSLAGEPHALLCPAGNGTFLPPALLPRHTAAVAFAAPCPYNSTILAVLCGATRCRPPLSLLSGCPPQLSPMFPGAAARSGCVMIFAFARAVRPARTQQATDTQHQCTNATGRLLTLCCRSSAQPSQPSPDARDLNSCTRRRSSIKGGRCCTSCCCLK